MKRAKLVTIQVTTRVVVEHDDTEDEIVEAARPRFRDIILDDSITEWLTEIKDDTEVPYNPNKYPDSISG